MDHEIYVPPIKPQLTIKFESVQEVKDLYNGLRKWTPHGGWDYKAQEFFTILEEVFDV